MFTGNKDANYHNFCLFHQSFSFQPDSISGFILSNWLHTVRVGILLSFVLTLDVFCTHESLSSHCKLHMHHPCTLNSLHHFLLTLGEVIKGVNQHMENSICFVIFLNESFPKQFISIKLMLMIILAILFESAASCFVVPAWLRITLHTFCHIADWLLANFSWMNIFTIPLQLAMTILLIFAGILERHFDMTSTEAKPVINKTKSLKSCDKLS